MIFGFPSKLSVTKQLFFTGEYGLRNKREVWRVKFSLAKIRSAARELLTLEEKDQRRLFEGEIESSKNIFKGIA